MRIFRISNSKDYETILRTALMTSIILPIIDFMTNHFYQSIFILIFICLRFLLTSQLSWIENVSKICVTGFFLSLMQPFQSPNCFYFGVWFPFISSAIIPGPSSTHVSSLLFIFNSSIHPFYLFYSLEIINLTSSEVVDFHIMTFIIYGSKSYVQFHCHDIITVIS